MSTLNSQEAILNQIKKWDNEIIFRFVNHEDITKIFSCPIENYKPLEYSSQTMYFMDYSSVFVQLYDKDRNLVSDFWIHVSQKSWCEAILAILTLYPKAETDKPLREIIFH